MLPTSRCASLPCVMRRSLISLPAALVVFFRCATAWSSAGKCSQCSQVFVITLLTPSFLYEKHTYNPPFSMCYQYPVTPRKMILFYVSFSRVIGGGDNTPKTGCFHRQKVFVITLENTVRTFALLA